MKTVEVHRLIWGDYGPRYVGNANTLEDLGALIDQDGRERGQEARQRVYSVRLGDREVILYGRSERLLEALPDVLTFLQSEEPSPA